MRNLIHYTIITRQVLKLIQITVVGTDVCIRVETGELAVNSPVRSDYNMTI